MLHRVIILVFLFLLNVQAQEYNFDTHSSILKGELTKDDIFETDFGRFDAYELQMEEGDFLVMKLKSSFFPLLTIVAPSNEYKVAFPNDEKSEVVFEQQIDESGLWQIYIAGDSTDIGPHSLQLFYVSQDSRKLPKNANYCSLVQFFLSHAKTGFFYFKDDHFSKSDGEWVLRLMTQNLYKSGSVITKNGISRVTLILDNKDDIFKTISEQLKVCLKKQWNIRENKNGLEILEIEGLRKIFLKKEKSILKLEIYSK
ncbi:MAG: hypothetical protein KKE09_11585 [Bacteroidetes bacterium]|nr:hypothetical protein [Bacteroidota bacterium]